MHFTLQRNLAAHEFQIIWMQRKGDEICVVALPSGGYMEALQQWHTHMESVQWFIWQMDSDRWGGINKEKL